jgi:anti-anti-sigma factor
MGGDGCGVVLRPAGDLDVATVGPFRKSVERALAQQPPALLFDLADVEFLDSSGLSVLAVALKGQRARGGAVAVINPQPIVRRAITLVGLDLLFDVTDIPASLLDVKA